MQRQVKSLSIFPLLFYCPAQCISRQDLRNQLCITINIMLRRSNTCNGHGSEFTTVVLKKFFECRICQFNRTFPVKNENPKRTFFYYATYIRAFPMEAK